MSLEGTAPILPSRPPREAKPGDPRTTRNPNHNRVSDDYKDNRRPDDAVIGVPNDI